MMKVLDIWIQEETSLFFYKRTKLSNVTISKEMLMQTGHKDLNEALFFFPVIAVLKKLWAEMGLVGDRSLPRAHIWIDIFRKSARNSCYWLESCTLWLKKVFRLTHLWILRFETYSVSQKLGHTFSLQQLFSKLFTMNYGKMDLFSGNKIVWNS